MKKLWLAALSVFLSGCLNMPTEPAEISPAYTSSLRYEQFECRRLMAEAASLSRREAALVSAQNQRIKTSQVQAFWWGVGKGDGVEAAEIATVRGEIEAVRLAMETKDCRRR